MNAAVFGIVLLTPAAEAVNVFMLLLIPFGIFAQGFRRCGA
jgi:hypothetical protein